MGLLLYKSDEMYSSTELIQKSKMIFDKVLDNKIDKAIILEDGKPCFLLMDFHKYEKIMAEYEVLKKSVQIAPTSKPSEPTIEKEKTLSSQNKENDAESIASFIPKKVSVPIQTITLEEKKREQLYIQKVNAKKITEKKIEKENISAEQEIHNAMQKIKSMNFDEAMRLEAEKKIKVRILEARRNRAKILEDEQQQKELKEELVLQNQIKRKKIKKDRELREFWD